MMNMEMLMVMMMNMEMMVNVQPDRHAHTSGIIAGEFVVITGCEE